MSVAAASLPDLATSDRARIVTDLERGMARIAAAVVPTSVAYLVLGTAIVQVLFGGGAFGGAATRQVAAVLAAYALGLLATTQARLLQSALYALDDTRTPARIAAVRVLVATAVGVALMLVLDAYRLDATGLVRTADLGLAEAAERGAASSLHRLGAAGLALGASVGAWTEWLLLRGAVSRRTRSRPPRVAVARAALASIAIPVGAPFGALLAQRLASASTQIPTAVEGIVALLPSALLFVLAAVLLGLDDLPGVRRARTLLTGRRR